MIKANHNITEFEGSPKELTFELTMILAGAKETFIKEFDISEEDSVTALKQCFDLAVMNNFQRKIFLDKIEADNER